MGAAEEVDYAIKPENATPNISMSDFPLLLKNYDKRTCTSQGGEKILLTLTSQSLYDRTTSHPFHLDVLP